MLKRRLFSSMPSIGRGGMIVSSLLLLVFLALTLAACASPTSASIPTITPTPAKTVAPAPIPTPKATPTVAPAAKPSGPIDAKWIEPQVNGDTVSIPVSEIEKNWNTRFKLQTAGGDIVTMAYKLDGVLYVRASICPPCRSQGFTLTGDILVCDTCGTRFKATTGEGVSGACVKYPKASVSYTISNGNVVMNKADLVTAHQNTLNPGWP
jgi:nitrite reductase/ring-hydroxylating ferredoxin subunit